MRYQKCAGVPSIVHLEKCTEVRHATSFSATYWTPVDTPHGLYFVFWGEEIMGAPTERLYHVFPDVSETQQGLCDFVESHIRGEIQPGYVYSLAEFQKKELANTLVFAKHGLQLNFE